MEHTNKVKRKTRVIDWLFLILLAIAIYAMINTANTLVKNKDIIQTDALAYGMEEHGFNQCVCMDELNKTWYSGGGGFSTSSYSKLGSFLSQLNDGNETSLNEALAKLNAKYSIEQNGTE